MHCPCGNHSDQPAITAQREADVKQSPSVCAAESLQPELAPAVANIFNNQQRAIEEDLLSFRLTDAMLFDALAAVAFVPIKSFDPRKVKHHVYYHHIRK